MKRTANIVLAVGMKTELLGYADNTNVSFDVFDITFDGKKTGLVFNPVQDGIL